MTMHTKATKVFAPLFAKSGPSETRSFANEIPPQIKI